LLELAKDFIEDGVEFTMDTTTSVDEAIRRVMDGDYDAVICDYQMPAMNGVEFLKALRSRGDVTPFVLFTGRGREEVAIEALNSGRRFLPEEGRRAVLTVRRTEEPAHPDVPAPAGRGRHDAQRPAVQGR